ncbi:hypothetical protein BC939DRAFT_472299 [Gamsiella multidivaricata]|uniref:uncharacterized protein n=1 Tax=Gamsiella multidivaricata TaxID=101098 RepID=UPI00221EF601|nr:uncharacterized protein BC939DRAFT_472299 [Gamsiella multidivaricata]KAI7832711.1 hypothetical protein BC939DRAFT_472299 [Gamsiella multidivaricata]
MASLSGTDQLHLLICQCPALQTLLWRPTYGRGFPHAEFCALYIESKWPDLDSITFKAAGINIPEESHFRLLQVAKQPFRVLDYHLSGLGPRTLELLMDQHFATMQSIDLCYLGNAGKWAIKVLTSFPRLERFSAETIFASHILEGEPWVCHGLKELTVFIDMDVVERGQFRNQLSAKEIQQCRGIYRQLAALRELRVLDMLSKFDTIWGSMGSALKVPLPFCLDAGLELMAGSVKLKKFKLWPGREEVNERELAWILEHWKQLRRLDGGWCCTAEGGFFLSLAGEQKKLLNKHGINITEDTSDDRAVEARLRWNE